MVELGKIGKMDMIVSVVLENILGLRTPTRRGEEIMSKLKYGIYIYYRCEGEGHWSHTYCTPKHLVELYQKYRPKSELCLMDKADPIRETI